MSACPIIWSRIMTAAQASTSRSGSPSGDVAVACRQAEVLNELTAVSALAARQGLQRKEAKDAAEREEKHLATLRMDLADGLQAGILIMMATATYCALWIGFPQLQLGRWDPELTCS